ncbi:MAG: HAD-IIB family hydrolase [Desulfobacteraceae bacterium]|nr:HAD-IIB family hydrolase [Desulfobacteraceae bacterium]
MKPFSTISAETKKNIRYVLTDIDDTLTVDGILVSDIFIAMERLRQARILVVPITGRPAGWCDHMARMWPIDALVGENGAFYFYYDQQAKIMRRRYWKTPLERHSDAAALKKLESLILEKVPGAMVSADQRYREADLAIDFCEDVPPLPKDKIQQIVRCFQQAGARAKISSIHVNGWFGDYDKLSMTRLLFAEIFNSDLEQIKNQVLYIGDSPNDAPMFAFFKTAVGVANVRAFIDDIDTLPAWITEKKGGYGFAEMVEILLAK